MHTQLENSQARQGQSKKSNDFNSPVSKHSQVLVKAQLEMTTPGDSDEQEADEMADSIVSEGRIGRSVSIGHSGGAPAILVAESPCPPSSAAASLLSRARAAVSQAT